MPLTVENFAANLVTARRIVGERLGVDPSNLTFEERKQFVKALAAYITQYPLSFAPNVLEAARVELQSGEHGALTGTGYDLGQFVDEALVNARKINPLDPEKINTTLLWLLGATVIVAIFYWVSKAWFARPSPKPSPSEADE
ncbi:MAG: hypothetical protein PHE83_09440 [Opitutaceae bacterium]|nr:hypothetical protein [Opitutaceae bacterium]